MKNLVAFLDVNKIFNSRNIYKHNLSFEIYEGLKFVVSGKSGTGKTTLLNMIMGFSQNDLGSIKYNTAINSPIEVNKFRLISCYLPQNINFFKSMTVKEVLEYPFTYKNNKTISPSRGEIHELLDRLNLSFHLLGNRIEDLSGGERQRLFACIAFLLKRKVIILDEPTSNLDKESAILMSELFFDSDKTLIISTHDDYIKQKADLILELL